MFAAQPIAEVRKSERLDVRIRPDAKQIIEQAAHVLGMSTTDFASATLVAEAQSVLDRHQRIVLSNVDRDRFLQALDADEEPNDALVQAAYSFNSRYKK